MIAAVADTHAVIWYLAGDGRLSHRAREIIDSALADADAIAISSITLIEMVYLIEKGRISAQQFTQLASEIRKGESVFVESPVDLHIARALTRVDAAQVPDMPDRIIAATALRHSVPLISRDGKIRLSSVLTVW